MVPECTYLYPDGRRCRRIPKRGERLCRDHKRARRLTHTEDVAFSRHVEAYADRLIGLPLDVLAGEVGLALADMRPIIESRFGRTYRLLFSRAEIAVAALAEELKSVPPPPDPGIASRSACAYPQPNQMHPPHFGGLTSR